ncbi:MAG: DUF4325 domain-containing protein [Clostridia bacterium]|nr:DUF4325 domain-containing protein [Clostridia bacterium]
MKYSAEKKQAIISYILEKIASNTPSLSSVVAETFGISTNTVHTYINELLSEGIIKKQKRGEYSLVSTQRDYVFSRSKGELFSDTHAFDVCLKNHISHLSENVQHIWIYAVSEMVNNVIDHSNAETMSVTVVQNYQNTHVLITDNGVGIFEKIKNHFSLASLDEAICELFKGKLTTDENNHSGEGIFFTSKMMDSFLILSSGKVFSTSKYNNDKIFNITEPVSGTSVFMSLSNFTNKSARDIFESYSNLDGAFTTTKIPLKNIFDSAPVSRSQAKRLCNRLDQFEEVILDFDGVAWMGQGFAHQLFVVYQKAHPTISLKAENMNESVANMYAHVLKS